MPVDVESTKVQGPDSGGNAVPVQGAALGDAANAVPILGQGSVGTSTVGTANAAVVTIYAAVAGQRNRLTALSFRFDGANTAGVITVEDGATTVWRYSYAASQTTSLDPVMPAGGLMGSVNTAMTITLPAGGAGIIGTLSTARIIA